MSTYTEPLVMLDLHARNVDQAHRDIIHECLDVLTWAAWRFVPEEGRGAILDRNLTIIQELTQLEAEFAGPDDMSAAGDYSEALHWLALDAEAAVNDHTPYRTGTITESGTWIIANPAWWEGVDA